MKKIFLFAGCTLLPSLALAHPGHEGGLTAGLLHPFSGLDHLVAMLAIGMWAALQPRSLKVSIPAAFMLALLGGFVMGVEQVALPHVETGIALSVLLLGLLLASAARLPATAAVVLSSSFALFHGYAHGAEATGSLVSFAVGFVLASLSLHLSGGLLSTALQRHMPRVTRTLGALIAASGVLMMV